MSNITEAMFIFKTACPNPKVFKSQNEASIKIKINTKIKIKNGQETVQKIVVC